MKLNSKNKEYANMPVERKGEFPDYMEAYIAKLPPASQNNARHIVRADFRRIMKLHPMTASRILADKYDMHPDLDISAKDFGEPSNDREDLPF